MVAGNIDATNGIDVTGAQLTTAAGITNTAGNITVTGGGIYLDDNIVFSVGTGNDFFMLHKPLNGTTTMSVSGDVFLIDNTNVTGETHFDLGSNTSATALKIHNNSGTTLFSVDGAGLTTINNLALGDSLLEIATTNTANTVDIGTYGKYVATGTKYTGIFWDASDSKYRLFNGLEVAPTTTVNIAGTGYTVSTLVSNLEGIGDSTITGSLTVDNLKINDNNIGVVTDLDLLTLTNNQLVVAGNLDVSSGIDITADNANLTIGAGTDITLGHDGVNSQLASTTGNFTVDNTNSTGKTIMMLGTDTATTEFVVQNDSAATLLKVDGAGDVTIPTKAIIDDIVITNGYIGRSANPNLIRVLPTLVQINGNLDTTNGLDVLGAHLTTSVGITNYSGEILVQDGNIQLNDGKPLSLGTGDDVIMVHDGTNSLITSTTGNFTVDNTNTTGDTVMQLGTDDANTKWAVKNNSGVVLFEVKGDGTFTTISSSDHVVNDANNAAIVDVVELKHTTTGTPGIGIGTSMAFVTETSNSNNEEGMRVGTVTTNVGAGTEAFDMVVNLMAGGATADEKLRLTSVGDLKLTKDKALIIGVGSDLTLQHDGNTSKLVSTTGDFTLDNTAIDKWTIMMLGTDTSATEFQVQNDSGAPLLTVNGAGDVTIPTKAIIDDIVIADGYIGRTAHPGLIRVLTNIVQIAGNLDATNGIDVLGAHLTTSVGITNYSGEILVQDGNLQLNDGKPLSLGTGDDVVMVHDGTNSLVTSTTGNFTVDNTNTTGDTIMQLGTDDANTKWAVKNNSGAVLFEVKGDGTFTSISSSNHEVDDSNNTLMVDVVQLKHTTTGTPGVGIGTSIAFVTETTASNNEEGMRLGTVVTNNGPNIESFDMVVNLMAGGAVADEKLRLTAAGDLKLTKDKALIIGVGSDITLQHDGTNSKLTTTTGNFTLDNTANNKKTIMMLGTNTAATAFDVQNNSGDSLFRVDGDGWVRVDSFAKFGTTSIEIDGDNGMIGVTGDTDLITLTANQLVVAGNIDVTNGIDITADNANLTIGAGTDITLGHDGTNSQLASTTGNFTILNSNTSGKTINKLGTSTDTTFWEVHNSGGGMLISVQGDGYINVPRYFNIGDIKFDGVAGTVGHGVAGLMVLSATDVTIQKNLNATVGIDVTGAVLTTAVGITNTGGEVLVSGGNVHLHDNVILSLGTSDDCTFVHNGTNTLVTSNTGDYILDNTSTTGEVIVQLGTDDTNTRWAVKNNSGTTIFEVKGNGDFTTSSSQNHIVDDATNTGVTKVVELLHTTTGTPGVGIGTAMAFVSETANANNETGMVLGTVTTNVGSGTEAFDMTVNLMVAGATADEKLRLTSVGDLKLTKDKSLIIGVGSDISLGHDGTNSTLTNTTGNFTLDNTANNKKTIMMLGTDTSATSFEVQNNSAAALFKVSGSGTSTVTGVLAVDDLVLDGTTIGHSADVDLLTLTANQLVVAGNVDVTNGVDVTGAALTTAAGSTNTAGEVLVSGGNMHLNDGIVLSFGTGNDLQIQHTGALAKYVNTQGNTEIEQTQTGSHVFVKLPTNNGNNSFRVQNSSSTDTFIVESDGKTTIDGSLVVDSMTFDSNKIGPTADLDLLTLNSAHLIVSGNLDVTNGIDVTGAVLTTAVWYYKYGGRSSSLWRKHAPSR